MVFNSTAFACFFAIVVPCYWLLGRAHRLQNVFLLAAGYYFYASWNPRFLALLVLSTVMDYACGLWVDHVQSPGRRKAIVALSMTLNLAVLAYFKYFNFFAESLHDLLSRLGVGIPVAHLRVVLPIGISFYTFQSMSYVIDVYRRDLKPTRNLVQFAAFVSFFPHLVAGPIMRPTTLLPQIANRRRFDFAQFQSGAYLIFWGLFKKVVVADNLATLVSELFGHRQSLDGGQAILAVYAFAFQIYGDFSGYTDMARGVARCLGFELSLNFNLPYFATSPRDFWNRWHISLSQWLRDYLYIPLGGGRGGSLFTYRNLMITMALGGLWHGAKWTFVVWGVYQGSLLVAHRLLGPWLSKVDPRDAFERACWTGVRIVVTFHLVCLGWLIFRADSLEQAMVLLRAMIEQPALPRAPDLARFLVVVVPLLMVQIVQYASDDLDILARAPWYARSAFYTLCYYGIVLGGEFGGEQFIYFQF